MKQTNMLSSFIKATPLCVATFLTTTLSYAAPGVVVTSPLYTSATAKPNILVLTDTSGSMRHVVPEDVVGVTDKYDSTVTYIANCGAATVPVAIEDGGPDSLYIRIIGNKPHIRRSTTNFEPGTASGEMCFTSTKTYNASLHADSGTQPAGSATAIYSGNYLNWYFDFDNTTTNWDAGQQLKPGTDYRMNIARTSLKNIVTGLTDNMRVGLATLNGGSGATIDYPITTLTGTATTGVKKAVLDEIDTFSQGGSTPMAEALHQIGRYFLGNTGTTDPGNLAVGSTAEVNGQTSGTGTNQLTLHTELATPPTYDRSTVFPTNYSSPTGDLESPIQYWCQNNFVIFMSDGVSNSDINIPTVLRDYDEDCSVTPIPAICENPFFRDRKIAGNNYFYEGSGSDYFDDVAQALFEIDLRPDIDDFSGNEALNNVRTYTIAFADAQALNNRLLKDAASQAGGEYFTSKNASDLARDFNSATNSILSTTSTAAAVTFNTSALGTNTNLYQVFFNSGRWSGDVNSYPVNAANGDVNTNCVLTNDTDQNCWNAARHIDLQVNRDVGTTQNGFDDTKRTILTYDSANNVGINFVAPADYTTIGTAAAVAGEITQEILDDLCAQPSVNASTPIDCTSTATGTTKTNTQTYIQRMFDYLRGDDEFEASVSKPSFRQRLSTLGDIINANPVYVGEAEFINAWPSEEVVAGLPNKFGETGKRYSDFNTAVSNRLGILYVAANDGMIHGIQTADAPTSFTNPLAGDELFAYIPSYIFNSAIDEGLHYLANPNYNHKNYLDLSPTVSDIYTPGKTTTGTVDATYNWRTVLIGGTRGGELGFFALDVTDPTTLNVAGAKKLALWEFTEKDETVSDLGQSFSQPTMALTNAVDSVSGLNRWAAIFGNGYNNHLNGRGGDCNAVLYILFMDAGLDGTWTEPNTGTATTVDPDSADFLKISTKNGTTYGSIPASTASTDGPCNGLSTPQLADLDGDGTVDRVYAGDVQGNMWAFDLTCGTGGCNSNSWKIAHQNAGNPAPLFTAEDNQSPQPSTPTQSITSRPALSLHYVEDTTASNSPNIMVYFGTGQYHSDDDKIGTSKNNTIYAIWDKGTNSGALTLNRAATTPELQEQTLNNVVVNGSTFRTNSSNSVDWNTKRGWFIDLDEKTSTDAEERLVVSPQIQNNTLFFNTIVPNSQVCGFGGFGWLMAVDIITGGEPVATFDVNANGIIDGNDGISGDIASGQIFENGVPAESSFRGNYQYTAGSDGSINKDQRPSSGDQLGRQSWQELQQ